MTIIQKGSSLHIHLLNSTANSFGRKELDEFLEYKSELDKAKLIVLTSDCPRFFCSGGNLKDYHGLTKIEAVKLNQSIASFLQSLSETKALKVAYVDGLCFGGGIELISAFDLIWSSPNSIFGLFQRRNALSFGWLGGQRLKIRMSLSKIKDLFYTSRSFVAEEAFKLGLVDELVLPETFNEKLERAFQSHTSKSEIPLIGFDNSLKSDKEEQLFFNDLWHNPDHKTALDKFNSKKK